MGGRDQWGNIVCGVELVRRTGGRIVFGLTTPLIETASGAKMGKTAQGAVWLTADRLPASDYWQFWRNTEDADVKRFLRLFTEEDVKMIDELPFTTAQEINDAKRRLATEATALAHGRQIAEQIAAAMQDLYVGGRGGGHGVGLGAGVLIEAIPSIYVPREELLAGVPLVRVFVEAGLAASLSEVRRLMRNGGVRVNDVPVSDENLKLTETHLQHGVIRLSAGRKQHRLVRPA
jgi:tyrosyl-tRNA synthetase